MIRKCLVLVALLSLNAAASGQEITLKATEVEPGLTMLEGEGGFAGGNMAILTGEDGVILIDDGLEELSELVLGPIG